MTTLGGLLLWVAPMDELVVLEFRPPASAGNGEENPKPDAQHPPPPHRGNVKTVNALMPLESFFLLQEPLSMNVGDRNTEICPILCHEKRCRPPPGDHWVRLYM